MFQIMVERKLANGGRTFNTAKYDTSKVRLVTDFEDNVIGAVIDLFLDGVQIGCVPIHESIDLTINAI